MVELLANSEDPDQTPHSVASGLGLHCLPITLLGFPDYNGVNNYESHRQKIYLRTCAPSEDSDQTV